MKLKTKDSVILAILFGQ